MSHNSKKLAILALVSLQSALMLAPGAKPVSYTPRSGSPISPTMTVPPNSFADSTAPILQLQDLAAGPNLSLGAGPDGASPVANRQTSRAPNTGNNRRHRFVNRPVEGVAPSDVAQTLVNHAAVHAQHAHMLAQEADHHATAMQVVAGAAAESQAQQDSDEQAFFAAVAIVEAYVKSPNPTNGTLKPGYAAYSAAANVLRLHARKYIEQAFVAVAQAASILSVLPNNTVESNSARAELALAHNALNAAFARTSLK